VHKKQLIIVVLASLSMMFSPINCVIAQSVKDSLLHEINVTGKQSTSSDTRVNDFSPGQKIKAIDTATLQQYQLQSMANLLSQQVSVFVKSYGFNGLATLSFRGSSAAQSQVLWNGVPIQNTALGVADVSTLPVMLMNKVNIVYGGSAALWGSGNVGGALLLENDAPVFDSGKRSLSVAGGLGSFSQYLGGLKGSISGRRWYFSGNVFAQVAENNFPYTDAGLQQHITNDHLQSVAALVQGAYRIGDQHVVSLSAWYQQYDRQIPPALFEPYSDKRQDDGSLRLLASWHRQTGSDNWYAKTSFITDNVRYTDDIVQQKTNNTAYQYYQEAGWKKQWGRFGQLLVFIPVQVAWINLPGDTKYQNKAALAGAYELKAFGNLLNIAVNARDEVVNGNNIFLPGANASLDVTEWLSLRANAQRTYRVPSLNELYYDPGGNARLKPEQGWSEDGGYSVKMKLGSVKLYHDLSLFNRDIHDWIIWLGGAVWTPHNIAEVHSRGLETENDLSWTVGKWAFHLGANTSYVLATTVSSYFQNDGSTGKQIPYAPRYSGQANVGFSYKRLSLNYNHTYTGYRFMTMDESEYVPPYQTGNVQLMYNTAVSGHSFQFTGQCNNIWNAQYQVVANRPMPGINWLLGIKAGIF
jgi:vitamin B12 transporter